MYSFLSCAQTVEIDGGIQRTRIGESEKAYFGNGFLHKTYFIGNYTGPVSTLLREVDFAKKMCYNPCLLYTSPSPRDGATSRMPSSA